MPYVDFAAPLEIWVANTRHASPHALLTCIDDAERTRLSAMHPAANPDTHILAHALKRLLIARELGSGSPATLRFGRTATGKPFLRDAALHFSLSHSGTWAALIVSRHAPCGVDIEGHVRSVSADVIERTMSSDERAAIAAAAAPATAFLERWTVKEATVKATGEGMARDFRTLCCERAFAANASIGSMLGMAVARFTIAGATVAACSATPHARFKLNVLSPECLQDLLATHARVGDLVRTQPPATAAPRA